MQWQGRDRESGVRSVEKTKRKDARRRRSAREETRDMRDSVFVKQISEA